ncbi:hypothetical protein O181_055758 [Austropuccinia psidii MF-1]|uniref:CCHC-type domain-containing protein n=1 Tax=Austropuccinia psidii MF-1 TaxID=1389203 RepID=A0A9Q3EBU8_9BASI|nr:hypothetical protein [Austropuccinia psidii MF-1]
MVMETNNQVSPSLPKSSSPTTTPLSFAAATAGTHARNEPSLPKRPPPSVFQNQLQENNRFKKFHIVIQTKFGAPKPFKKTLPQEAYNRINKALMDANANVDNMPIQIKVFTHYPSGDIKLYTRTRMEARWLFENRAAWAHQADPLLVMSPPTPAQPHQILKGGLIFDGNFMRTMTYTPGPPQCFNCLKTGHQAYQCKEDPTFTKCGNAHKSQNCKDLGYDPSIRRCMQCVNQDKSNNQPIDLCDEKYCHSALSQKCPICQKEIQNLKPPPRVNGE